jgi:hypothetical protein
MSNGLLDFSALQISTPHVAGALTIFPIVRRHTPTPNYLTLGEALDRRSVHITEISDGGSVPTLLFVNLGAQPVLLLDGEELVGAKQNRVLNLTILAPAQSEIRIPVSCIEQGRWHWRSRNFEAANRTLYASARAEKMAQVSRSMRYHDSYQSDQSAIWDSIERKVANFEVHSATGAASDIFDDRGAELDRLVADVKPLPDQVGAAFMVRGRLSGAELFGSAHTFATLLPKLVRSYGLDAIDERQHARSAVDRDAATLDQVTKFLTMIEQLPVLRKPALGLGEDLRFEDRALVGAALVHEERVVHLSAFVRE